eukprot:1560342-Prymnesium_polylepis.1
MPQICEMDPAKAGFSPSSICPIVKPPGTQWSLARNGDTYRPHPPRPSIRPTDRPSVRRSVARRSASVRVGPRRPCPSASVRVRPRPSEIN